MSQPNPNMTYEELRDGFLQELHKLYGVDQRGEYYTFEEAEQYEKGADKLIQLFATLGAEVIESGKVDGMFIEWNGLDLTVTKRQYAYLAQLTTKNTEENV